MSQLDPAQLKVESHTQPSSKNELRFQPVRRRPPSSHPRPYDSPLWPHLDTIRTLRRRRQTWAQIASHLEEVHGLRTSLKTVQLFFKRAKRGRIPLGFSSETPGQNVISHQRLAIVSDANVRTLAADLRLDSSKDVDPLLVELAANDPFANLKKKYEQTRTRNQ